MKLNIRKAEEADISELVALWADLNQDQISSDPYYEGALEFSGGEDQYKHALSNDKCAVFVGEVEGQIIGYIEVWIHEPDFYFMRQNTVIFSISLSKRAIEMPHRLISFIWQPKTMLRKLASGI